MFMMSHLYVFMTGAVLRSDRLLVYDVFDVDTVTCTICTDMQVKQQLNSCVYHRIFWILYAKNGSSEPMLC